MDSIVPAVFANEAECVKWSVDFGLSVTSRLLDSLMKFLRGVFLDSARCGLSMPTVACCSRNNIQKFWSYNDCFRTESRFRPG